MKNAAKGYEKTKPKQTQFRQRVNLLQSLYLQRIMKINADMGSEKTNPKQTQFQNTTLKACPEPRLSDGRINHKLLLKCFDRLNILSKVEGLI